MKKCFLSQFAKTIILVITSVLFSCTSNDADKEINNIKDTAFVDHSKDTKINDETSYVLPSPAQVAIIYKKSGLKYYEGLTINTNDIQKYANGNEYSSTFYLGMFTADMAYCMLNQQAENSKKYYKASKILAEKIGLIQVFNNKNIIERIDRNILKQDSIITILSNIQSDIEDILVQEHKEYISPIAFSGAWIESIYLAASVYEKSDKKDVNYNLMFEQILIARNLIKSLKSIDTKDEFLNQVINDVQSIYDVFFELNSVKELVKDKEIEDVDLSKLSLTSSEIKTLIDKIKNIRNNYVSKK
jgi:hypothetical protein